MLTIPRFDDCSDQELYDLVHSWIGQRGEVAAELEVLDQVYQLGLPRLIFLKSLPSNSTVLDVGAGDGSLVNYKEWPLFRRPDLRLHALSLEVGEHFHRYESFEIKDFETEPNLFPGIDFDALVCCHFIEHMREPERSIEFFSQRLRSGGRIYLEWPHPLTKRLPSRTTIIDRGVDISTFNFFDDQTHVEAWPADVLIEHLERNGFAIETAGRIHQPWIGEQLRNAAHRDRDLVRMTLGAWTAFGWAQYLIAEKK